MDEETTALILKLQIEDLESIISKRKRKGKAGEGSTPRDEELSIELQKHELQRVETLLADNRMTRSISRAVEDDGPSIVILTAEERRSTQDRELACRLSGQPASTILKGPDCRTDDDVLSRFGSLNIYQDDDDAVSRNGESVVSFTRVETGESSSWAATRKIIQRKEQHECVACSELRETIQGHCQHHYCRLCIVRLFTDATVDETLFPPRCCGQTLPVSLVRSFLSTELIVRIEQKAIEFGTPNRTYCISCRAFINPDRIEGQWGTCPGCSQRTCMLCKGRFHSGDCLKDAGLEDVLRLARETGWQRCSECHSMIELRDGCNHITCRCGAHFCYQCGLKWKQCVCILYDEEMLRRQANMIANRPVEPGAVIRPPRAERVHQIMNDLRERHECDHGGRWRRVEGPHRCEECRNYLREYILECPNCMLQACVRCRRNRL